jgi:hypothetical protein
MRHFTRAGRLAAVCAVAILLGGCTSAVGGTPVKPPASTTADGVDVALLQTGNYPTRPRPPLGDVADRYQGGLVEAARMADHVVGPWEIDPELTDFAAPTTADIIKNAGAVESVLPDYIAPAAADYGFVNGFVSRRNNPDPRNRGLQNVVLRFADPASAAGAAADFNTRAFVPQSGISTPLVATPIPGHPDTLASSSEFDEYNSSGRWTTVRAFTARGPYVLIQRADSMLGPQNAIDLVAKTLDLQIPAIDTFQMTSLDELNSLAEDPSGLLARTLTVPSPDAYVTENQEYGARALLHFSDNPTREKTMFADAGTDLLSRGTVTNVYQTRDGDAAMRLVEGFVTLAQQEHGYTKDEGVAYMPRSRCVSVTRKVARKDLNFYACFATADRYVIFATSGQRDNTHQAVAAQFLMLTAE